MCYTTRMLNSTTNDETPRNCNCCAQPAEVDERGNCEACAEGLAINAYDSERYLNSAWQEEQYSARYEDRYGPGYDPYED